MCDDAFTSVDATVACRQLGLTGGTTMTSMLLGAGPIWLDDVGCGGSETALTSCSNLGWGVHNCSHSEDTWVTCSP